MFLHDLFSCQVKSISSIIIIRLSMDSNPKHWLATLQEAYSENLRDRVAQSRTLDSDLKVDAPGRLAFKAINMQYSRTAYIFYQFLWLKLESL